MKKNKRKKGSSLFGLIFLLVIIGLIGYYVFWTLTKSNLTVMVNTYFERQILPKAMITIDGSNYETQLNGMAVIDLRVDEGDTLLIRAQYQDMIKYVSLIVNKERLGTEYTKSDILLTKRMSPGAADSTADSTNNGNKDLILKK